MGSVLEALSKIASEYETQPAPLLVVNDAGKSAKPKKKTRKRAPKLNAAEYAAKMELPPDKQAAVVALAERFDRRKFMHSFGDIENFCQIHHIDVPKSRSRTSAIPRIFKFLAGMEMADIQRMLDYEMFSGPAEVAPIADAIRRNGRASRARR